jgi:molybdate transport system ATP-binding protein
LGKKEMSIKAVIRKRLSASFTLETDFETGSGCLGILGPSGSGKSMTLKCIAGIETPDEGHISINGRVLFDSGSGINQRPRLRRVGYLFQNYALFPRMTVLENIAAALPPPGKKARQRALTFIEQFGLSGLENRLPGELSGGEQQRTALARMLAPEPEAILLDEPFSALDTNLREEMQALFLALLRSRQNAIMVSHNHDEIRRLCGEALTMEKGRVAARGKTAFSPG